MLKLIVLISIILVLYEVRSNGSNLVLNCPPGSIASKIFKYKCSYLAKSKNRWSQDYSNCLFCMTCLRNPSSSEVLSNVEVCLVTQLWCVQSMDNDNTFRFTPQTDEIKNLSISGNQNAYCGISLSLINQKPFNGDIIPRPCDGQQDDSGSKTTELSCPNSFFLVSHYVRTLLNYRKTWCINCQSYM